MNKILLIVVVLFLSISTSFATIFLDGAGAFVGTGDAKNQLGLATGLGYNLNPNINLLFRFNYSFVTKDSNDPVLETEYTHNIFAGGVEYQTKISPKYHLDFIGGLLVGFSQTKISPKSASEQDDSGLSLQPYVGVVYDVTQRISPFVELGYHKSFYSSKLKDSSIGGVTAYVGVRFSIYGINRDLSSDY